MINLRKKLNRRKGSKHHNLIFRTMKNLLKSVLAVGLLGSVVTASSSFTTADKAVGPPSRKVETVKTPCGIFSGQDVRVEYVTTGESTIVNVYVDGKIVTTCTKPTPVPPKKGI